MDTLGYVGRGLSTFQLVSGTLIGILLLIIGVLMFVSASKGEQPSTDPSNPPMSVEMKVGIGIGLIILGIIIPYGSWINRKLVRGNDKYASVSGALSLFTMFGRGRR
jgi:hypothetical protein